MLEFGAEMGGGGEDEIGGTRVIDHQCPHLGASEGGGEISVTVNLDGVGEVPGVKPVE